MSGINTNHKIYLKVLTPIYIGGAQEKDLQEDLDFIVSKGITWKLNWKKIYEAFDADEIATAIVDKNMVDLLSYDIEDFAEEMDEVLGTTGEIKAFVKDGYGRAYIPGSSIKGAMKNWLHSAMDKNPRGTKNLFGAFDTDLFRFIKPTDCYFEEKPVLYSTKIFNLHNEYNGWQGGWKHSFKSRNHQPATTESFNNRGFVTDYECMEVENTGSFNLSIRDAMKVSFKRNLYDNEIKRLEQKLKKTYRDQDKRKLKVQISTLKKGKRAQENLYNDSPIINLFRHVNSQLRKHLQRELDFFKNYNQAEGASEIIESFEELLQEVSNLKDNQCLLRLSAGSGFHGITGDFQFKDHVKTGKWRNGKVKYKSRKIAFTPDRMSPMGFVLLSTKPFEKENKKEKTARKEQVKSTTKVSHDKNDEGTKNIEQQLQREISNQLQLSSYKNGDSIKAKVISPNDRKIVLLANNEELPYATITKGSLKKARQKLGQDIELKKLDLIEVLIDAKDYTTVKFIKKL